MQTEHRDFFYSAAPIVTVLALVRLGLGRLGLGLLQTRFCSRYWPAVDLQIAFAQPVPFGFFSLSFSFYWSDWSLACLLFQVSTLAFSLLSGGMW